ncbi:uncharacterized protein N0V89_005595 [Didymosphaeria variabile]|uniref:Uncharacterized protein n=1 Tax=Didymosphaeria variabile TaxID=1932322 RepID=A0A9W8XNH4_9PLEO|nr:uncharacterized protein N0V89_005595 [Didymosphaeria variabile]KAJ4353865.1 hypothetical protein N0V89_005595 [Didymosphaeria variabile]
MPKHGFEFGHSDNIPNSTNMTSNTTSAADSLGQKKDTNAIPQENPSIISSAGAIGKQFNPDGAIGQIGEKIGGPLSSQGAIGSQFDASKDGIAGHVERAVDGPRNPAGSGSK